MIEKGEEKDMFFWIKSKNKRGVQYIEDFKIGDKIEVSVFRFSQTPIPAESISYIQMKKK